MTLLANGFPRLHGLRSAVGIGAALLMLAGCNGSSGDAPEEGTVSLAVSVNWPAESAAAALAMRPLVAPPGVAEMKLFVTVGPFVAQKKVPAGEGSASITNVPPGDGTLQLDALDSGGAVLYSGSSTFSGSANAMVPVTVDMTVAPSAKVAPWPPTGVTAFATGTASAPTVTVTWNPSPGASSYNLYRSSATGGGLSGTKLAGVASGVVDSSLSSGTSYFYAVTALNGTLESGPSGEASAKTLGTAPPAPPATTSTTTTATTTLSVTVSNLRNLGVTHSGFVVGTAGGGSNAVSAVEVSLDSGSYTTATGTTAWSYKLPTGGSTWKENSAHTIAVRARDSSNNLSTVATLSVRKGVNQDVNGDGYADVVVGAYNTDAVYVFHSAGASGIANAAYTSANATLTGPASSYFGVSVALGDVNGDGYADLTVGAFSLNSYAGAAYVFQSAGASGIASAAYTSANAALTGPTSSDFGHSVALGDVNGDGYADLAVGAYGASGAYVFHSAGASGIASADYTSANATLTGPASSQFGVSVALTDPLAAPGAPLVVAWVRRRRGGAVERV